MGPGDSGRKPPTSRGHPRPSTLPPPTCYLCSVSGPFVPRGASEGHGGGAEGVGATVDQRRTPVGPCGPTSSSLLAVSTPEPCLPAVGRGRRPGCRADEPGVVAVSDTSVPSRHPSTGPGRRGGRRRRRRSGGGPPTTSVSGPSSVFVGRGPGDDPRGRGTGGPVTGRHGPSPRAVSGTPPPQIRQTLERPDAPTPNVPWLRYRSPIPRTRLSGHRRTTGTR